MRTEKNIRFTKLGNQFNHNILSYYFKSIADSITFMGAKTENNNFNLKIGSCYHNMIGF